MRRQIVGDGMECDLQGTAALVETLACLKDRRQNSGRHFREWRHVGAVGHRRKEAGNDTAGGGNKSSVSLACIELKPIHVCGRVEREIYLSVSGRRGRSEIQTEVDGGGRGSLDDGDVALRDMPVGSSRKLVEAQRIEDGLEDADDETLVAVVFKGGNPSLRATDDRMAALAHPLTVGLRDQRPLRKESEAISEIDPA
jgi:hypothetical protein